MFHGFLRRVTHRPRRVRCGMDVSFKRVFRCAIEVNQFDFRENLQCLRVLDHAVRRQPPDQRIRNGIRHGCHQSHAGRHEPERDSGQQDHPALEPQAA